jgi:serine/threonine-protein kinase
VAWNSAVQWRDRQQDVRALGQSLQVAAVLTCSVRISGTPLRVRAQLIEASSGIYLWSETYDRPLGDLFSIQEEIARAIVRTLRLQLSGRFEAAPIARGGANIGAYDLYLQGRHQWNKRTREGLTRSVHLFEQAIAVDSGFALAYSGLADAYALQADFAILCTREAIPKAREAARRALELDPDLAEAWTSLAFIRSLFDWEWVEAELMYRRAIELNPSYATARHWLGVDFLAILGRLDEALVSVEEALRLDPLSFAIHDAKGIVLVLQRDYAAAADHYRSLANAAPDRFRAWSGLGRASIHYGRFDDAIHAFERALSLGGDVPNVLSAAAQAYAFAGRGGEARRMLARLNEATVTSFVPSPCMAMAHMAVGEVEEALRWLEHGCEEREVSLAPLRIHPAYDALRTEPRFQAILRRMNLAG